MRIPASLSGLSRRRTFFLAPVILMALCVLLYQARWLEKNRNRMKTSGVERLTCPLCQGRGKVMNKASETGVRMCPVCFGVGFHAIRRMTPYDQLCPACGGAGRLEDEGVDTYRTCGRCEGRGLIETETQELPYPATGTAN